MQKVAIALSCLAYGGAGWRKQVLSERLQSIPYTEASSSSAALEALAVLLQARIPVDAFGASCCGSRTSFAPQMLAYHRHPLRRLRVRGARCIRCMAELADEDDAAQETDWDSAMRELKLRQDKLAATEDDEDKPTDTDAVDDAMVFRFEGALQQEKEDQNPQLVSPDKVAEIAGSALFLFALGFLVFGIYVGVTGQITDGYDSYRTSIDTMAKEGRNY